MARRIVIAGGGFGGFYTALALERLLPPDSAKVTLVNDVNFMLYTPLLPGAAGGSLEPRHVVVPLRKELKRTNLRLGRVTGLNREHQKLEMTVATGERMDIDYDQLVISLGSTSKMLDIPGLAENAVGFKTLAESIYLRNHVVEQLELAESTEDSQVRRARLGFVFVGGGYAGVEALAELHDFATALLHLYPRCRMAGMRWVLIEATSRILSEIEPELAKFAAREIEGRGIEIRTETTVELCSENEVKLSTGDEIPMHTLVWTAGVVPSAEVGRLGLPLDEGGRIKVSSQLQVEGCNDVWAVGDAAAVPDPASRGRPCPPTAQHAIRQGRVAAKNVAAALGVGNSSSYRYQTRGLVVDLGRNQAVVSIFGFKLRGFLAWWITRTYHMYMMPGLGRKLRLIADWTVGVIFSRDPAELSQIGHPPTLEKSQRVEIES